jgi:hypothetical protein
MTEEEVLQIVSDTRERLEPLWDEWRRERGRPEPACPSEGMCRFAAQLLARRLTQAQIGDWIVTGGAPQSDYGLEAFRHLKAGDGGIQDSTDAWQGHYWALRPADGLIADVTADQFGHDPVVVTDTSDSRYRPNYKKVSLLRHLRDASVTPARWEAAIARDPAEAPAASPARR